VCSTVLPGAMPRFAVARDLAGMLSTSKACVSERDLGKWGRVIFQREGKGNNIPMEDDIMLSISPGTGISCWWLEQMTVKYSSRSFSTIALE
jgi:hypothetical protein